MVPPGCASPLAWTAAHVLPAGPTLQLQVVALHPMATSSRTWDGTGRWGGGERGSRMSTKQKGRKDPEEQPKGDLE